MRALPLLFLLAGCAHQGTPGKGTDTPLVVVGTVATEAGADASFLAHLGPEGRVAIQYDFGTLEHTVVMGPQGARQTNFSGQVEPLSSTERTEFEALAAALRARPPLGEAWPWEIDGERETFTFSEIRRRRGEDLTLELVPRPVATLTPGPTTSVPLTVLPTGHLSVVGHVGGAELHFLVDTGAGITVLDQTRAQGLGIEVNHPVTARGIGGNETVFISAPAEVTVGDATLSLAMAQLDLRPIAGALGVPIDGVLGKELFRAFAVGFDRSEEALTLYDRGPFQAPEGYVAVPLSSGADGRWRAPIQVDDHPAAPADLDTGSNDSLLLYHPYTQQLGLPADRPTGSTMIGGVGGVRTVQQVRLHSLTFAGHVWTEVPVTLGPEGMHLGDTDARVAGNLGNAVLGRYDLVFDTVDAVLWASVRNDAHGPFTTPRAGLVFSPHEDGWYVAYVAPEWEGGGAWASGDLVTHVDGQDATTERLMAQPMWSEAPVGTEIRFTMVDGATRVITLADWW